MAPSAMIESWSFGIVKPHAHTHTNTGVSIFRYEHVGVGLVFRIFRKKTLWTLPCPDIQRWITARIWIIMNLWLTRTKWYQGYTMHAVCVCVCDTIAKECFNGDNKNFWRYTPSHYYEFPLNVWIICTRFHLFPFVHKSNQQQWCCSECFHFPTLNAHIV